jgi:adenosine deaminase
MAGQNIRYVEMFFSPSLFSGRGLEVQKLTQAVRRGLSKVPEIEVSLVADLVRDHGPEAEMRTLERLQEVKDEGVIGIGIGGSEHACPPAPFRALFEKARRMGFHVSAHAGEAAGPESIWEAIRCLRVDRIGHGTRAREDPTLLDYLREHRIPLELCPISNVRTGVVPVLARHPIRDYFERGLTISVNTDDPKMFGTCLGQEYASLVDECGFTQSDIRRLVLLGIESSWLADGPKQLLRTTFENDPAWGE